ncbi:MAG: family 16 glycoside hydrolase [Candidatus Anammoxibacter sp.]
MGKVKILGVYVLFLLFIAVGCEGKDRAKHGKLELVEYIAKQIEYKGETELWNFENVKIGELPANFSNQMTGKGGLGKWEVIDDGHTAPSAPNVLAQTSQEYFGYHFNMVINEEDIYDDLAMSVKFKGVKGEEDQGGGPVWRYQDADNYYLARANPLENNFRVYKVVNGDRIQMGSGSINITGNEWHTINIINRKDRIQCFYDGRLYIEVVDDTFKNGKIGLWAKADAVTYFDDLEVRPVK